MHYNLHLIGTVHIYMFVYMYMIIVFSILVDLLCSEAGDWESSENVHETLAKRKVNVLMV